MKRRDPRRSIDITLEFPLVIEGQAITKVTVRRPEIEDYTAAANESDTELGRGIALVSAVSGLDPLHFGELAAPDLRAVMAAYSALAGE